MAKKMSGSKIKKKDLAKGTEVIGLVSNLILPGLGTIISGKYDIGTIQIVLAVIGIFLSITIIGVMIGIPLYLAMWIWALITSLKILKNKRKK